MKLQQLRYLIAVAEEGSMLRAARRVGIAQPAMAQQLTALENSLGARLLRRSPRGTHLTRSGLIMLEHARAIIEQVSAARQDVLDEHGTIAGEVSLTIASAISEAVVPGLIKRIRTEFPSVVLRIQSADSGTVETALQNARVDMGVLPHHDKLTGVNSKPFREEPLCLVSVPAEGCRHGATDSAIAFRDAIDGPLVLVEKGNPLRGALELLAHNIGATLDVQIETNSLLMIRSYVESGAVRSILPHCAVAEKVQLGALTSQRIADPSITQTYLVAWPKTRPLSRAGEAVVKTLLQSALLSA